jgi:hypothetical protein
MAALHPDWSPAEIRSALAATADTAGIRKENGITPADPFDIGSGRLNLERASRIGLVLDESHADFLAANPATGGDPRTLNVPAMVDQECNQSCGWARELTSVAAGPVSYTAATTAPAGMTVTVSPASFTIQPGETRTLEITADVSGMAGGDWAFAEVRLETGDQHLGGAPVASVHYPVAVVPVAAAITVNPAEISADLKPDRVVTPRLTVGNDGTGDLTWRLAGGAAGDPPECTDPDTVEWLDVTPRSGTIGPDDTQRLDLTLDSTGQAPGVLTATLCLDSNDPAQPLVTVPVTLTVLDLPTATVAPEALATQQPGGTVTGLRLTIGNTGTAPLEWSIAEAADAEAAAARVAAVDPERLALLRAGVLLIPDTTGDRVMAFHPVTGDLIDPDFIPFNEEANLATPGHVILNAEQDGFLLADQLRHEIHAYDLNGQWLGVFAPAGGADTTIAQNIRGIRISPSGTLLATVASGANSHAIAEFDAEGNFIGNFIDNEAGGLRGPWDILFRDSDILISAVASTAVHQFELDGTAAPDPVFLDGISFPQQLHELPSGNLLIGQFSGSTAGVWEVDGSGNVLDIYRLGSGRGAYELPNGNILATNGGGQTGGVHELSRVTGVVDTKFTGPGARLITPVQLDRPCDSPEDVSWLRVEPASGITPAGGTSEVTVLVDSAGLPAGEHLGHLCVTSNDPDATLVPVPVTLTVTEPGCDQTVTGTHRSPLVVTGGLTCLSHGSEVTGPVTVRPGASLFASGATVIGSVSTSGAGVVEIRDSELTGPVSIRGGTFRVGLAGNQVIGPVSLVANATGAEPIVVSGNTIIGLLSCVGNQPPPVDNGVPNTVVGPTLGQCAGF